MDKNKMNHLEKGIYKGLKQALEFEKGRQASRLSKDTVSVVPVDNFTAKDVQSLRRQNEMSQSVFAKIIGVSTKTVIAWESGFRKPTGAYARILQIITHDPKTLNYLISKKPE